MLDNLPDDLISTIIDFLPDNKKRLINTTIIIPEYERNIIKKRQQFASNQLKMYIKLLYFTKLNIRTLDMYLATYFRACHTSGSYKKYRGECLMYAPFVQYGMCRFCSNLRHQHRYSKMMDVYMKIRCLI